MSHKINPLIDCVFKTILGSEKNKNLLIHFLNAVLELKKGERIYDVTILNPYNEREFTSDKLTVVDVKARDEKSNVYQIEVQLAVHADLKPRMLYTWSSTYHAQIEKGEDYDQLKPVISIWILDRNLFKDVESFHLPFSVFNTENKLALTDHLAIHVIQLPKWKHEGKIKNEKDRWIYLFKEGKNTDFENPPEILTTKEMRQVMQVLKDFSENQKNFLLYQSRLDAARKENAIIKRYKEKEEELKRIAKEKKEALEGAKKAAKEKEKALMDKEKALRDKEKALEGKKKAVKDKEKALEGKKKAVKDKEKALEGKKKAVKDKEKALEGKKKALMEKKKADEKIKSLMLLLKQKGIEVSDKGE
ncbi:Putative transposase, RpnA-like [Desulfonema limicola]|uniref:Transposase, RpnA-like n=1 Tax=Desulfonema limicola TaxID=45656 RepID=A0A975GJ61_9BACT|nr:Rpn family recombination-promoting nuclease/putative transposase [Desulfonema limicola]QTA83291.1 Putative transposase, RpnA-like [Desulfonema limicola]